MMSGNDWWIAVAVQFGILIFVLTMLGIIAFSLWKIARHLSEISAELKRRNG